MRTTFLLHSPSRLARSFSSFKLNSSLRYSLNLVCTFLALSSAVTGYGQGPNISYSSSAYTLYVGQSTTVAAPSNSGGTPSASNAVSTYAGSGSSNTVNNTNPLQAQFSSIKGMVMDGQGNLFVLDNNVIRKVAVNGAVTTFAGNVNSSSSTNGQGTSASFGMLASICLDPSGNLYVTERFAGNVRKITPAGAVTTLASGMTQPSGIVCDNQGNVYVSQSTHPMMTPPKIFKITPSGTVSDLAGGSTAGTNLDGTGSAASFETPIKLTKDASGNLYALQSAGLIRKITLAGVVTTLNDGTNNVQIAFATDMVCDASGDLLITQMDNSNQRVIRVTMAGAVTVVAGATQSGSTYADNSDGSQAKFVNPESIALDAQNNIYVGDAQNPRIRRVQQSPFSIFPFLPAGLSFNNSTGAISGTASAMQASTAFKVTAINASGSSTANISVLVTTPPPVVSGFSPASGAAGTSVTISGSGFNATAAQNVVYFGAVKATVSAASATSLTVTVPVGATYKSISVTNLASGYTAYSRLPFLISGNTQIPNYAAKQDFTTGSTPEKMASGDFDGDGKVDFAVVNRGASSFSILRNTSTGTGNVNYATAADFTTKSTPKYIAVADFDNDGKLDVAIGYGTIEFSMFRNTSTGSGSINFATRQDYIPSYTSGYGDIVAGDADMDGLTDMILTHSTSAVMRNNSTGAGTISLDVPVSFSSNSSAAAVGDVDNDGKADVVANNGTSVSVFLSTSAGAGNIVFANGANFAVGSTVKSVVLSDFDGDGYLDIATVNTDYSVSVLRNTTTTVGSVSFATGVNYTGYFAMSATAGDMNGDGKPDLLVTKPDVLYVFQNTSTSGTITFDSPITINETSGPGFVHGAIADVDGDGKPDMSAIGSSTNKLSVYRMIKPLPTITGFSNLSKSYGDADFTITDPTSNSGGAFTYTSSNTSVATISGSTVTVVGVGTATITATQAATSSFEAGSVTATLTVGKANPTLSSFGNIGKTYGDAAFTLTAPTSSSNGAFTYTSSNSSVASISGSTVTIASAGTVTITATQAATANYNSGTITATLTVAKANPTLSGFATINKIYGDAAFTLTAPTSNSGSAFSYTSSNTGVATISSNTVTIVSAGTTTITATQAATANYNSGTITASLVVAKAPPAMSGFSAINKIFGDADFNLTDPTSNSSGTFTYTSSNTSVATISGNTVSIAGIGTTTITATQAADANYDAATATAILTVRPQAPAFSYAQSSYTLTRGAAITPLALTHTGGAIPNSITGVSVLAGSTTGYTDGTGTAAKFYMPYGVAVDAQDNLYVADSWNHRIRKATPAGVVTTVAGSGTAGYADGTGTTAQFNYPKSIAVDGSGNMYVADQANNRIRKVTPAGVVTTVAGSGTAGYADGTGTTAQFNNPTGLCIDGQGNLYVADNINNRIRKITSAGVVTTLAGSAQGYADGTGTAARFYRPINVAVDGSGNVYVTDQHNQRIRKVTSAGVVTTVAGSGTAGTADGTGTAAQFNYPYGIVVSAGGDLYVTHESYTRLRKITPAGVVTTDAATLAYYPIGLAFNSQGDLYISIYNFYQQINKMSTYGYSVSPTLPAGLTLNNDGSISGTPTATSAATTYTITGTNATSNNTATISIAIGNPAPTITNFNNINKTYGNAAFALTAPTSNSSGAFSYTSSNTAVATISGSYVTIVGAGTATITATQAASVSYSSGSITATLTVAAGTPTLNSFANINKTYGNADFNITAPTSNSNGAFTYTSSNASVATISGNTVTITGVGSATITATQAATANYNSGTITATLTVGAATPTLSNFNSINKVFGDAAFAISAPTSASNGAFTYTSSNASVATVSGNTITIVGTGNATITATQAATANYTSASTTATLTVNTAAPTLSGFANINKTYGNAAFTLTAPSSNSNGAFTYASSNTSVATISGSTVTIVGAGTVTITATQAASGNYSSGSTTATLTVAAATPTIGAFANMTKTYGNAAFSLTAPSSNSGGAFSYTSSNTSVATISGTTVTIVGAGTATITATQAATANYSIGSAQATLTVNGIAPTVGTIAPIYKAYGDPSFTLTDPASNSSGAFTYAINNTAVGTITGNSVTITGLGTATITATQAAAGNYTAASTTIIFVVTGTTPVLSNFGNITKTFGDPAFTLTAPTSNSTGSFSYISTNSAVATISGNTVTIRGTGSATIIASQLPAGYYDGASTGATLTVSAATPTITGFGNINKQIGNIPFTITAPTSNSNGAFTYTSSNASVATISGSTVTFVGIGTATITATQAAAGNYTTGNATTTLTVSAIAPTITGFNNINKAFGDPGFTLAGPTSNSAGAFTYTSSNTSVATINGNAVTIVGAGTATITAIQSASGNYSSGQVTATLTVGVAMPTLGSFASISKTYGDAAFALTAPVSNSNGAFSYTSSNPNVATISGSTVTIHSAGTATITALQSAAGSYAAGFATATLTVNAIVPTIGGFSSISKAQGDAAFTLAAPVSNSTGAFSYTSSNTSVATVSGSTVTIVGAGTTTLTATQAAAGNYSSASITTILTVGAVTAPSSVNYAITPGSFTAGSPVMIQPSAGGTAATWTITPALPAGLVFNTATGAISGTPTVSQAATTYTITATNNAGSTSVAITFAVAAQVTLSAPTLAGFGNMSKAVGDPSFPVTDPQSNSNGSFSYSSSNPNVATISGNVITIHSAGTAVITAMQAASGSYASGSISATLTVGAAVAPSAVSYPVTPGTFTAGSPVTIQPSAGGTAATWSIAPALPAGLVFDPATGAISGTPAVSQGATTYAITATNSAGSTSVTVTFAVNAQVSLSAPTITGFGNISKTQGDAAFQLAAPTTNSNGSFSYTSSNPNVATVNGNIVTILNAGTVTITATQAASGNYTSGSITATLTVSTAVAPSSVSYPVTPATFTAGSPVVVQPLAGGTAAVWTITPALPAGLVFNPATGAISGTPTASQAATAYTITATNNAGTAAVTVTIEVNVASNNNNGGNNQQGVAPQISSLNLPQTLIYGSGAVTIAAPGSNNSSQFTYSSSNSAVATVSGNTLQVAGVGTVTITATQPPSGNYLGGSVTATLTVTPAPLTIRANDAFRCVGYSNPQLGYTATGFVSGEDASVLTTQPVLSTTATPNSAVGNYSIMVSGAQAANYSITYVGGTLQVASPLNSPRRMPAVDAIVGEQTPLQARSFGTAYQWSPATGLSNAQVALPFVSVRQEQQYTVSITESTGCVIVDTVKVRVFERPDVFVPSLFSPNGDGINDVLQINPAGIKQLYYFKIFNRNGKLVFQSNDLSLGWNGKFNGTVQAMDTYSWIVSTLDKNGKVVNRSGSVTLVK